MSLNLVAEVWEALKIHVDFNDRKDAADTLVNLLIDNGFDSGEIKESFPRDKDIANALRYYREQHETEEEYEDLDEDEDFDEWN